MPANEPISEELPSIEPVSEEDPGPEGHSYEGGFESADPQSEPGASEELPLSLVLDHSYSMNQKVQTEDGTRKRKIAILNEALRVFARELKKDEMAAEATRLNIIAFGGDVEVITRDISAGDFQPPELEPNRRTPMADAIVKSADLGEQVKKRLKQEGKAYARHQVMFLTDGKENASSISPERAAEVIAEGEQNKHLNFWAVGTEDADFQMLRKISNRNDPVKIKAFEFVKLFRWLSNSIKKLTNGATGSQTSQNPLPV